MKQQSTACLLPFSGYLTKAPRSSEQPAHWAWQDIYKSLANYPHGERGTVALVTMARADAAEVAPGLSLAVQTVLPSSATGSHRHSFWHLYWVASGTGEVLLEKNESRYITTGDIVYVPPWCSHSYSNSDSAAPLVLFALQNLPQLAALGVLMREEEDGARVSVHRSPVQLEK